MSSSADAGHLFRVLYPRYRILYVEISLRVFEDDHYVALHDVLGVLPAALPVEVNFLDNGRGFQFKDHQRPLRGITTWHEWTLDILKLPVIAQYSPFIFETIIDNAPAIGKYAHFEYELHYFQQETDVYRLLEGSNIGPRFISHLIEDKRGVGIAVEKIVARRAR